MDEKISWWDRPAGKWIYRVFATIVTAAFVAFGLWYNIVTMGGSTMPSAARLDQAEKR